MLKSKPELDKILKLLTDGHNGMESLAMLSYLTSLVFIFKIHENIRNEVLNSWTDNVKESIAMGLEAQKREETTQ